jgi:hypothetical protein
MSGPIVRKYGFPNFEKIFGERPMEHGVEDKPEPQSPQGHSTDTQQESAESRSNRSKPKASEKEI